MPVRAPRLPAYNAGMREPVTRIGGAAAVCLYAAAIAWTYARQPQTIAQVTGGLAATVGAYRVDRQAFDDGLRFFYNDQFVEARSAFARADSAQRDPTTQFYIAYSYYRQGWGRLYSDDALFRDGLEAVRRAIDLAPGGRIVVNDPRLGMHSADELEAELRAGLTKDASDLDPRKLFRERK